MPTYYVEDYNGERSKDAVEPLSLNVPDEAAVTAKVVEPAAKKSPAKKTSAAKTKG